MSGCPKDRKLPCARPGRRAIGRPLPDPPRRRGKLTRPSADRGGEFSTGQRPLVSAPAVCVSLPTAGTLWTQAYAALFTSLICWQHIESVIVQNSDAWASLILQTLQTFERRAGPLRFWMGGRLHHVDWIKTSPEDTRQLPTARRKDSTVSESSTFFSRRIPRGRLH